MKKVKPSVAELQAQCGKNQRIVYCCECSSYEFTKKNPYVGIGGNFYHRKCLDKIAKGTFDIEKYKQIDQEYVHAALFLGELKELEKPWCCVYGQHNGNYFFNGFEDKVSLHDYIRGETDKDNRFSTCPELLLITHDLKPVLFDVRKTITVNIGE